MLPTFVIGLREGLEAALIVGIIAAFLRQRGRLDLLRKVWLGVGIAVGLCLVLGIALKVLSAELPQRQQEGLETVIGLIAVAMVTYMVVWMRRHSRDLKGQLEGAAESAVDAGGTALVAMAFLAVLREGFETAVFLVAAFNQSSSAAAAGSGAVLGIVVACGLGYGIYRGGVRINLSKFFRATGAVLVLVAAGLVVSAAHTAHEAGWLNVGQGSTVDLTWLVRPGSVQSSLLTGMLGWQPRPVTIEVVLWLVYLIPVGLYVTWPPGRAVPVRAVTIGAAAVTALAVVAAVGLYAGAPERPHRQAGGRIAAATVDLSVFKSGGASKPASISVTKAANGWQLRTSDDQTSAALKVDSRARLLGRDVDRLRATLPAPLPAGLPATLTLLQAAQANSGRLPLGVNATTEPSRVPVEYSAARVLNAWVDRNTGRLLDANSAVQVDAVAHFSRGPVALSGPIVSHDVNAEVIAIRNAAAAARKADDQAARRSDFRHAANLLLALAGVAALVSAGFGIGWWRRRRRVAELTAQEPARPPRQPASAVVAG